jgi:hypothetical protein
MYPIYLHARAPLHDIYDSCGTVVHSTVGKFTVSFREVDHWTPYEFERQGFSGFDLVTNIPIGGPCDLRRYEVASMDCPKGDIQFDLGTLAEIKRGWAKPLPPHQVLAADLGIEPEWFDKVNVAWYGTRTSEDQNPEDNDEFYAELDKILDQRDELEFGSDNESEAGDDIVEPSVGFTDEPTTLITESNVETTVATTVEPDVIVGFSEASPDARPFLAKPRTLIPMGRVTDPYGEVEDALPKKDPEKLEKIFKRSLIITDEATSSFARRTGKATGFIPGTRLDPGDARTSKKTKKSSKPARNKPEKDPTGSSEEDRNPPKRERRKSFEIAAARLSAIPRTQSGEESLRPKAQARGDG